MPDSPIEKCRALGDSAPQLKALLTTYALARTETAPSQDACDAQMHRESVIAALADGVGRAEMGR